MQTICYISRVFNHKYLITGGDDIYYKKGGGGVTGNRFFFFYSPTWAYTDESLVAMGTPARS